MTLSPVSISNCPVNITKEEAKFINSTFKKEQKYDRQLSTQRRNDDNGYNAAITCLARDMVTATPEEAYLIAAKINFFQNLINYNLQLDADLKSQKNSDSRMMIETKTDAYTKKAPYQTELLKSASNSFSDVADTVTKLASTADIISAIK